MTVRSKAYMVLSLLFLIISLNIFIALAQDTRLYKIQKNTYDGDIYVSSLNNSESPSINKTVNVNTSIFAPLQYHYIWKDFRDQSHTAIALFSLIGYNNTLSITVSKVQYVQYADVTIRNKHDGRSERFYFHELDVVIVNNSKDYEYQFYISYSYNYFGCLSVINIPFCDESGSMNVMGEAYTKYYDFFPSPPAAIPGYNMLYLFSVIILGFFYVLVIRKHQKRFK